ncbi:MAG: ABC transporter permease [Nanoarchaeota archaeon]|nr:ABC transporter permease [Nanoarchaeota archaeon]
MIKDYFNYGWKNMKHRQLRSWLTILGVVIGIAAIVSLISFGQGFENAIVDQFGVLGADRIRVTPEGLTGPPVGVSGLTEDDVETVKNTRGVDFAGGVILSYANLKYNNFETPSFIKGIEAENAEKNQIDVNVIIEEGSWFGQGESGGIVIGPNLQELFDKDIYLKNSLEINGEKFKVVGILESVGSNDVDQVIYMSMDDIRDLLDKDDEVNAIFAAVEEGNSLEDVARRMEKDLEKKRGDDNFNVFTPDNILNQLGSILGIVQFILGGIAGISLLVGGIGIMNSMYTSVLERTKQIGLMKAVGASQTDILSIFMIEAGIIGLVGGTIGIIVGYVFAFSVQGVAYLLGFSYLKISLLWNIIGFSLAFAFIVGMLSGLYPAYKASQLKPVDALRYE